MTNMKLSEMTVTALRKHAKDLGLRGLSKAPKDVVLSAIKAAQRPQRVPNTLRVLAYTVQNGTARLTPAQQRRVRKNARREV